MAAFALAMAGTQIHGQAVTEKKTPDPKSAKDMPDKKYEDFDKVTKGAKEIDGLFKLWHKDENLYMEIKFDPGFPGKDPPIVDGKT